MIEVNLLPEDRRPVERTPLPRFLTIVGGVIGLCIELIFVYFVWTLIPPKRDELTRLKDEKARALDDVKAVKETEKTIKEIRGRKLGIEKLANDRRLWAPIFYRLCDPEVLPERVWYQKMELFSKPGARGRPPVEALVIDGYAASNDDSDSASRYTKVTQFVRNLQQPHPEFSDEFDGVPSVGRMVGQRLKPGDDSPADAPNEALSFSVRMPLKAKAPAK